MRSLFPAIDLYAKLSFVALAFLQALLPAMGCTPLWASFRSQAVETFWRVLK